MPVSLLKAFGRWFKQKNQPAGPYAIEISPGTTVLLEQNRLALQHTRDEEPRPLLDRSGLAVEIGEETKILIARKICRLLPELVTAKKIELLEYTLQVLKALSTEQVGRVRRIIAEELAENAETPHELAIMLAWDLSPEVHQPVLECSPVLTDDDLIEIIRNAEIPGVAESIARRRHVSAPVSDAISRSGQVPAVVTLLDNKGAEISEPTLEFIADHTQEYDIWVEPLVKRPELSLRIIRRISGEVSQALIRTLQESGHITEQTATSLTEASRDRLKSATLMQSREKQVDNLINYELLDLDHLYGAMERGDRDFVLQSLSRLSGFSADVVERMLKMKNPKLITALAWKSGLPMRAATQLQRFAGIHHREVLLPKDGTEYPIQAQDLKHLLELFEN